MLDGEKKVMEIPCSVIDMCMHSVVVKTVVDCRIYKRVPSPYSKERNPILGYTDLFSKYEHLSFEILLKAEYLYCSDSDDNDDAHYV